MFYKKGVLRTFTKFTGTHLCQSTFFNKVAGLRPANLLCYFPMNFIKFLRTPFLTEHLWWLFWPWRKTVDFEVLWVAFSRLSKILVVYFGRVIFTRQEKTKLKLFTRSKFNVLYLVFQFDVWKCKFILENSNLKCCWNFQQFLVRAQKYSSVIISDLNLNLIIALICWLLSPSF